MSCCTILCEWVCCHQGKTGWFKKKKILEVNNPRLNRLYAFQAVRNWDLSKEKKVVIVTNKALQMSLKNLRRHSFCHQKSKIWMSRWAAEQNKDFWTFFEFPGFFFSLPSSIILSLQLWLAKQNKGFRHGQRAGDFFFFHFFFFFFSTWPPQDLPFIRQSSQLHNY